VTVKTRLGIDDLDSYQFVSEFISHVAEADTDMLILHARKAWLSGLSPKENRDIPPLDYSRVYQLKQDFADLHIDINGGIHSLAEATQHLNYVDGVMMGRAVYHDPYLLAEADRTVFGIDRDSLTRHEIIALMLPYIEQRMKEGRPLKSITRHLLGLFQGQPGAKAWRRHLSEHAHKPGVDIRLIDEALSLVADPRSLVE
jgi:tRNA-dihydrouridine synthase A